MGAFAELGSYRAWPPPCGAQAKVVSAGLNLRNSPIRVKGVRNFLGSVSSQQKFEAMDGQVLQPSDGPVLEPSNGPMLQFHVTAQFYLESKGKCTLEV